MDIDLNDLNPTGFFPWPDGSEGGLEIRILNGEKFEAVEKTTVKTRFVYRRGQRFEEKITDTELRDSLTWDYCIVSWEGFKNKSNGENVECTVENKIKMMKQSNWFPVFFSECVEKLTDDIKTKEEVLEKN